MTGVIRAGGTATTAPPATAAPTTAAAPATSATSAAPAGPSPTTATTTAPPGGMVGSENDRRQVRDAVDGGVLRRASEATACSTLPKETCISRDTSEKRTLPSRSISQKEWVENGPMLPGRL